MRTESAAPWLLVLAAIAGARLLIRTTAERSTPADPLFVWGAAAFAGLLVVALLLRARSSSRARVADERRREDERLAAIRESPAHRSASGR